MTGDRPRRSPLDDLDLETHLADPAIKQRFVTAMFDLVAPRYDRFTRAFSYGMDPGWKRTLVRDAARLAPPSAIVVDVACGTGDLAFGLATLRPDARVVGIDLAREMIRRAATSGAGPGAAPVSFTLADAMAPPFRAGTADVVTAGYAFRNFPDHTRALEGARELLAPGGVLLVLDFYRPPAGPWRRLFLGYLRVAGNLYGWAWHREPVAYGYIAASLCGWVTAAAFGDALRGAGFEVLRCDTRLGGGIALHVARRL